jgi:VanZ family protein
VIRPPDRLLQAAFFVAAVVAFTAAIWPQPVMPEAANGDKAIHFTSFYVLEFLALMAFRKRLVLPAVGLVLLGGLIEVVQGMVGRDRSGWDWLADILGVVAAAAPMAAAAIRRREA